MNVRARQSSIGHSCLHVLVVSLACTATLFVVGCQKKEAAGGKQPVLVRTVVAEVTDYVPKTSLTGIVTARTLNNLAFRLGGRVAERLVEVGQHVDKDTILARLDLREQESDVRAAQADLDAAIAGLVQTSAAYTRQKTLLERGYTTRRDYDSAEQALKVAQGNVEAAQSALANAKDNLGFTELRAGTAGVVTARAVEVGQVVEAAQTVYTVAEDGDRDAVFNVEETLLVGTAPDPLVEVALVADRTLKVAGRVREISPAVDPGSGSIRVKVALLDSASPLPLGAAVIGTVPAKPRRAVVLPWQALTSRDGKAAVWIVDPTTMAVKAMPIGILAYETGAIVVGRGVVAGQQVVTAGAQLLSAGEIVEVAETKP